MQFVNDGPDVPDRLLHAHEDGRVVFFCGAGISIPAGLPNFKGLVDRLYSALNVPPDLAHDAARKAARYDIAVDQLENQLVDGRMVVRRTINEILSPTEPLSNEALATHRALLTLSKCRTGSTRLITTNFDRLFEIATSSNQPPVRAFAAPLLPIPKRSRWNGLVYLHGLLPYEPTDADLDQLVISSGDFGLAYLVERWAARFVSELIRNFVVCFVGYSVEDPILRYMTDAFAARQTAWRTTA